MNTYISYIKPCYDIFSYKLNKGVYLCFVLLFICFAHISAQNQRFKTLSIEEGLSQSTVNCIIQDRKGLIWLGTQDGLNRYDGHQFTQYKKKYDDDNSIPDNNIQALYEDIKGNIWIGTYGGGICIYDPISNEFTRLNSSNSKLSDDIIMCFTQHDNLMYIGTKRGGLNVYDYSTKEIAPVPIENNTQLQIRDVDVFNNAIYTVTSQGGVHILEKNIWVKILDTIQIQVIKPINNQLWLGGVHGELYYKENSRYNFKTIKLDALEGNGIWGLSPDASGNLWIGSFGSGLCKIELNDPSKFQNFVSSKEDLNSISHDVILSLFNDKDGAIWIGTLGGGVNYFEPDNQKFKHFNSINGLSNNVVMSFLEDDDKLYIGTYGGGLNVLNLTTNKIFKIANVEANIVRCIYKDSEGLIWIGTYGNGILKYNPSTKKATQVLKNIIDDVWCIVQNSEEELWLGTWGKGLIKFNKRTLQYEQFLKTEKDNSISENTVLSIAKTKEGNLWVGTYGSGLNYFDATEETFKRYGFEGKNPQETNNKKIRRIYADTNDDLWIGTDGGGLNHYNNQTKEFNYITTENNLPNNVVYGVIENQNNIWVSTNYGLSRYEIDTENITNFDYDDGLQNNEFNQGALYINQENIYAGGINGFNVFNPKEIEVSSKNTNTIITSMKVMGKEHDPPIRYLDSINLHYTTNFLSFQFSHLDYSGKVNYRCMLDGLDKGWIYLEGRNYINYTNIPSGNYTLKFQGKRMGDWTNSFSILKITIPPPYWKTLWFYGLAISLLLIALYLFYLYKQRALKRKNLELEQQVKTRTQEIQQKNIILNEQKLEVEAKHDEIQASITYAKRIQSAILPSTKMVKAYLKDSFIIYKPKDIVAGDFYWMEAVQNEGADKVLFAAADCTGHGVPGAMVSVVCNNALNRAVREYGLTDPGRILDKTREIVITEFEKSDEVVKDGMDIALCCIDGDKLYFAGAHNPLWIVRDGELIETKANKQPIGRFDKNEAYTTHQFDLKKGDNLYVFTDGYVDQFGGVKGKKFKAKALRELLLSIQDRTMASQKLIIDKTFHDWKGDLEQIDDVCVIGVRI